MKEKLYQLMNWPRIEAVIYSEEDDPHRILGPHRAGDSILVQAFFPGAQEAQLCLENGKKVSMELADEAGFFAALLPGREIPDYTYQVVWEEGRTTREGDPYRYAPVIRRKDTERFAAGIHYEAYRMLGAHICTVDGVRGVHFAVWAPNAVRVSVAGDFNRWDGRMHQMRRLWDSGIFELFIPGELEGQNYKYELKAKGGLTYLKADPYAFGQQLRPDTASVVRDIDGFAWEDEEWIKQRENTDFTRKPVNVYELYLGSFRRPEDGRPYCNYRELAPAIIDYVKEMGYTHIELMPVMEHPFDGSWGYQVIGYYAPTARYGTPEDFMFFMNEMHKAGIGVILDWVPAHFPRDAYGLSAFDGTCLYEHLDPRQGSHPHWGTLIYNYGRPQVSNYLIANALFWIEQYHADGIRMDAVASMLYLDYGKQDGEWVANLYGGRENLEAVEFLKHVNSMIHKRGRGALSIAEESTAWPMVTGALDEGGLGFDMKWNMGWMNDFLGYIRQDPLFRSGCHNALTFSMVYAYSERFMLVLSHDEVVHGKASMIGKMPGSREEQFAGLKASYGYMMCHPGKKLLFMGQDIGEYEEWNENRQVRWELLEEPEHRGLADFVKALNHLYTSHSALYLKDTDWEGFEWIDCISANDCTLSFLRKGEKPEDMLLVVLNFANVERKNYQVGVPFPGKYKEILNSDAVEFGGQGRINARVKASQEEPWDGREHSIRMNQAPLSVSVFACQPYTKEELKEQAKKKAEKEKERRAKEAARRKAGKKGAVKPSAAQNLKEELAQRVFETDAQISEKGEVEKPVKVTRGRRKTEKK